MPVPDDPVAGGVRRVSALGALLGLLVLAWAADGQTWHLGAHARSVMVLGLIGTLAAVALASLEPRNSGRP